MERTPEGHSFNLDNHVSSQHLLRSIDQCLNLISLCAHLADFHSPAGRPSIDPELMVHMLVFGHRYSIRYAWKRILCRPNPMAQQQRYEERLYSGRSFIALELNACKAIDVVPRQF